MASLFICSRERRRRRRVVRPDGSLSGQLKMRFDGEKSKRPKKRACRVCGCTDDDCRQCITKTGMPCMWVEPDLCSACVAESRRGAS